jgi:hypothetical protein
MRLAYSSSTVINPTAPSNLSSIATIITSSYLSYHLTPLTSCNHWMWVSLTCLAKRIHKSSIITVDGMGGGLIKLHLSNIILRRVRPQLLQLIFLQLSERLELRLITLSFLSGIYVLSLRPRKSQYLHKVEVLSPLSYKIISHTQLRRSLNSYRNRLIIPQLGSSKPLSNACSRRTQSSTKRIQKFINNARKPPGQAKISYHYQVAN